MVFSADKQSIVEKLLQCPACDSEMESAADII